MLRNWNRHLSLLAATSFSTLSACGSAPESTGGAQLELQEFLAMTPYDAERDVYIVEGDIPMTPDEAEAYYWATFAPADDGGLRTSKGALLVNTVGGADDRIAPATQQQLTYCVSTAFGARHGEVVAAMQAATAEWEAAAAIDFVHDTSQDGACGATNARVWFDVRPVSGQSYVASAFFPSFARDRRSLLLNTSAFTQAAPHTLTGTLRHELGHALGFRHEHIRPMTDYTCTTALKESTSYRALTGYDRLSVMHYDWCGGPTRDYQLTSRDRDGVACMYRPAMGMLARCDYNGTTYRAHVASSGWGRWVFDGDGAGTAWQSKQMEAAQIKLQKMGNLRICYKAHVANKGWLGEVCDGQTAGTTGENRRMEAIQIRLVNAPPGCSVNYQAHVANKSWLAPVRDGQTAGTTGEGRRMEALRVWLTGCDAAVAGSWTPWLNRDNPGGNGDGEHLSEFQRNGQVCANPSRVECRRIRDQVSSTQTGEAVTCSTTAGAICLNADQTDALCDDYEVRFFCP